MMSLYGEYILEREGKGIIESEKGFATYRIMDKSCYLADVFVRKPFRQSHIASNFADDVAKIAKEKGCNTLLTSVVPSMNGSTSSLKAILKYGFRLKSTGQDFIVLEKEI